MYAKKGSWILGAVVLGALFLAAVGFVVMWLWNTLVPPIFSGPELTFWQALGLLALTRILVGGTFGRGRHKGHWKQKWNKGGHMWKDRLRRKVEKMNPEERAAFFDKARGKCNAEWMETLEAEYMANRQADAAQSTSS